MNITIDARLWGLENAGLGRYVMNLVGSIAEVDKKNSYKILLRKKYFETLSLPSNWEPVIADFRHYSVSEQLKLPKIITKTNPDIVHFPHFNVPLFYNGKFVVTIHDILMHKQKGFEATTLSPPLYMVKRMGYKKIFNHALNYSKAIIVPSNVVRKDLEAINKKIGNKIDVINEGISSEIGFVKGFNIASKYFVYAGNAYPHKNLKRLIEAIKILNTKYDQDIKLVIISGKNVFFERLKLLIHKMGVNNYVELLGFVPDKNFGYILKNSEGFVFPSLSEGFGLPGLEAMSVGVPVLASDIPIFREIYSDNALYFNPMDSASIAKKMHEALNMDARQKKNIITKGIDFSKKYSWASAARKTIELYGKV